MFRATIALAIIIQAVMAFELLDFFRFFRGTPHQMAAVKRLEEALPDGMLEDDAEWIEAWKASGIEQQVYAPYFFQVDNKSGEGERECFSSAAAMIAAFYKRVSSDDTYNKIRSTYGDTVSVDAQLQALRALKLEAMFIKSGTIIDIESEITSGRPVLVGWLHRGDLTKGEPPMGVGHWSVIVGFNQEELIAHDPMGMPDLLHGGHDSWKSGEYIRMNRQVFKQRWEADGAGTGWMILVSDG